MHTVVSIAVLLGLSNLICLEVTAETKELHFALDIGKDGSQTSFQIMLCLNGFVHLPRVYLTNSSKAPLDKNWSSLIEMFKKSGRTTFFENVTYVTITRNGNINAIIRLLKQYITLLSRVHGATKIVILTPENALLNNEDKLLELTDAGELTLIDGNTLKYLQSETAAVYSKLVKSETPVNYSEF